jgi:indolepyruvate ferredoxin oxidoreductase beta subunit
MRVQIVMAGIGGQGILFLSKIFSHLGLKLGQNVLGSETHGMSQRGGSVTAFIKIGEFHSPLIRTGSADFLFSLECDETYRALKFIKKGGICFVNLSSLKEFDTEVLDYLHSKKIQVLAFDASQAALRQGSVLSTNIALLGYSVGTGLVPFKRDETEGVLKSLSRGKNISANLRVFEAGHEAGKGSDVWRRSPP